ncbi:MAG: DHA2 family efflux MFS transporter permease subunit [Pseudomonadota bacterium]|nr:DHA2 family efflux MFS transporter permease subunit [Pseudomonadota bacterium]
MAPGPTIEDRFAQFGPSYRYLVTFTGMLGVIAMVLSITIVNVAVPSVMGAYGIGQDQAQWMATAFIATMTISQLLNNWLVEAFGQRLTFLLIIVVFFIGTAIAATSPTYDFIILGRILQGFSAGVSQPLVMVLLFQVFPKNRRGLAMGLYGMAIMLAPGIGPFIGGLAIDNLSWRYIFYIPLPLCAAAFVLGAMLMPGPIEWRRLPPFDWAGIIVLSIALINLLSAMADGQRFGWSSDLILTRTITALGAITIFVALQLKAKSPLLDMTLFTNPAFSAAVLVAIVFGFGNMASSYAIPVFVQTVGGYSATAAGLVLIPAGIVLIVLFPVSGRVSDQIPAHYPIAIGLLFFALGTALMTTTDTNTAFWTVAIYTVIGRFGMGLIMPPLVSSAMRTLETDQLNRGSGALNFMRQLGGSIGINSVVVLISQRTLFHSDSLTTTQTPANPVSREFLEAVEHLLNESGVPAAIHQHGALHYLGSVIEAQAATYGFQDGFSFISIVFVCALIPVWILKRAGQGKTNV